MKKKFIEEYKIIYKYILEFYALPFYQNEILYLKQ